MITKEIVKNSLKLFLLLLLALISFSYAMFQGGFVSWFVFYSFSPFLLYAVLLFFYPLTAWIVDREIKGNQLYKGDTLFVTVTLNRKIPLPLTYLIVEEVLPDTLSTKTQPKKILFPFFKRKLSFEYNISRIPRGEHHLSKIKLTTGDLLGLMKKDEFNHESSSFLVYPTFKEIPFSRKESFFGNASSARKPNKSFEALMVAGVRDFQAGDKMSLIDWKATARKQTIMTKEFESEQNYQATIILDCSQGQRDQEFEEVISDTASIVYSLIKKGQKYELILINEQKDHMTLSNENSSLSYVLYILAKVKANVGIPFSQLLNNEFKSRLSRGGTVIVTSTIDDNVVQSLRNNVRGSITIVLPSTKGIGNDLSLLENTGIEVIQFNKNTMDLRSREVNQL